MALCGICVMEKRWFFFCPFHPFSKAFQNQLHSSKPAARRFAILLVFGSDGENLPVMRNWIAIGPLGESSWLYSKDLPKSTNLRKFGIGDDPEGNLCQVCRRENCTRTHLHDIMYNTDWWRDIELYRNISGFDVFYDFAFDMAFLEIRIQFCTPDLQPTYCQETSGDAPGACPHFLEVVKCKNIAKAFSFLAGGHPAAPLNKTSDSLLILYV